jgi:hypothetical protein
MVALFLTVPLLHGGEKALSLKAVEHLATMLAMSTLERPYAGLERVRQACDKRSLRALPGTASMPGWRRGYHDLFFTLFLE